MTNFSREDFDRLARVSEPRCVSLLMPTHPTMPENSQDPIRLKNLRKQAEQALIDRGERASEARKQLEPVQQLVNDTTFWAQQRQGLAIYALPSGIHTFGAPFSLPERAVIGRHCYLVPFVNMLNEDARFYVLAISPKQVRLLEGTRYSSRELDLPGWPEDFEDLAAYIEHEAYLQFHTGAAPTSNRGDRAAVFHGHSGADSNSDQKQRLLEYCRMIDQRVLDAIDQDRTPLILASDERLASIYHQASKYPHIVSGVVKGNPDNLSASELCAEAWKLLQPNVKQQHDQVTERYGQAAAKQLVAKRLDRVLPAAHDGQVDTLLLAQDVQRWGQYDSQERTLEIHETPSGDDEELINLAAVASHQRGASLYAFPPHELPDQDEVAAILRYGT